jgi:hypothetical protein
MSQRKIETGLQRDVIDGGCLLCREERPEHCHSRLVAEYLSNRWSDVEIEHIVLASAAGTGPLDDQAQQLKQLEDGNYEQHDLFGE